MHSFLFITLYSCLCPCGLLMGRHKKTGASGRWNRKGYAYVFRDRKKAGGDYKIGSSTDPKRRLRQIRNSKRNWNIDLLGSYKSNKMRDAEGRAQRAVKKAGMKKVPTQGGATDWYKERGFSPKRVKNIVANAVRPKKRGKAKRK